MTTTHTVEIQRIHKSSPYNCAGYIPEIIHNDREKVIDLPEVQEAIDKTFGKKLIVIISSSNETSFLQYEIEKPKAIL